MTPASNRSPATLPASVLWRAAEDPTRLAVRQKARGIWRRYTWGELGTQAERLAAGLLASGDAAPRRLAVISADTVDALVAGTAIQAIGGAAVYIQPDLSAEELAARLTRADVTHVLAQDQEQCDKIIDSGVTRVSRVIYAEPRGLSDYEDGRLVSLTEVEKEGQALLAKDSEAVRRRLVTVGPDEVASIVFTAGLVQPARLVGLSHRHLMDAAARLTLAFPLHAGASYFLSTPLANAMSQYVAMAVAPSLPLVVNMPERPSTAAADCREIAPEILLLTAEQWRDIYDDIERRVRGASGLARRLCPWSALAGGARDHGTVLASLALILMRRAIRRETGVVQVKLAMSTGAPLARPLLEFFRGIGVSIDDIYGVAETGPLAVTAAGAGGLAPARLLATPANPFEIRIERGEIQVRGGQLFAGHEGGGGPEPGEAWFGTGDLGRLDGTRLTVIGRADQVIELPGGDRVAAAEAESVFTASPYIRVAVVGALSPGTQAAVLAEINQAAVEDWARHHAIADRSYAALAGHPAVRELIQAEILRLRETTSATRQIEVMGIAPRPLSRADGQLTHDGRVRRGRVLQHGQAEWTDLPSASHSESADEGREQERIR